MACETSQAPRLFRAPCPFHNLRDRILHAQERPVSDRQSVQPRRRATLEFVHPRARRRARLMAGARSERLSSRPVREFAGRSGRPAPTLLRGRPTPNSAESLPPNSPGPLDDYCASVAGRTFHSREEVRQAHARCDRRSRRRAAAGGVARSMRMDRVGVFRAASPSRDFVDELAHHRVAETAEIVDRHDEGARPADHVLSVILREPAGRIGVQG